jgi:hypothetical protein
VRATRGRKAVTVRCTEGSGVKKAGRKGESRKIPGGGKGGRKKRKRRKIIKRKMEE